MNEQNKKEEVNQKPENEEKKKNSEKKRELILHNVAAGKIDTMLDRVAWLLNHFPNARNSDITLQLLYWENFESDIYKDKSISPKDLYKLTRLTSIKRARATIQNTCRLFLASPEVRKRRGMLEEKEKAIQEQPSYPVYAVYADESGKNEKHLIVGSMWVLSGYDSKELDKKIRDFRIKRSFDSEFHFKNVSKHNLPLYKELIDILKVNSSVVGFKAISVEKAGVAHIDKALEDLYYHILIKGVEHENKTGRAPLPRSLQLWKDADNPGPDKIMLANLIVKLKQAAKTIFNDKLVIDHLESVDSKGLSLIQLADLFTGSLNRLLNNTGVTRKAKDELVHYFFNTFGWGGILEEEYTIEDMTAHIVL